jgi:hypothetical protein
MTNKNLIEGISELYSKARNSVEKYTYPDIKRGRKHSISSMAEDLLAYFILRRANLQGHQIWVDYPISFKNDKARSKTIYADIAIVKKENNQFIITHIVDLKLDLGWKRSLEELQKAITQAISRTNDMRTVGVGQCRELDDSGLKIQTPSVVNFSPTLKWHMAVMSNQNISKKKMEINIVYAKEQQNLNPFRFYVFSEGTHPNGGIAKEIDEEINRFIAELSN